MAASGSRLRGMRPSVMGDALLTEAIELTGSRGGGAAICGDHPVPGEVGGVGARSSRRSARGRQADGGGEVTVRGDLALGDRGDQRPDRFDLVVGNRRHRPIRIALRIRLATSPVPGTAPMCSQSACSTVTSGPQSAMVLLMNGGSTRSATTIVVGIPAGG